MDSLLDAMLGSTPTKAAPSGAADVATPTTTPSVTPTKPTNAASTPVLNAGLLRTKLFETFSPGKFVNRPPKPQTEQTSATGA